MKMGKGSLFSLLAVVVFLFLAGCGNTRLIDKWSFHLEIAESAKSKDDYEVTFKDDKCPNIGQEHSGFSFLLSRSRRSEDTKREKNCTNKPCCTVTIKYDGDSFDISSTKGKKHLIEVKKIKLPR